MKSKIFLLFVFFLCENLSAQYVFEGVLRNADRKVVIAELSKLNNVEIDSSKTIVINFYIAPQTSSENCIDHYTKDRKYLRFFKKKKSKAVQFFITEKWFDYRKANATEDVNNVIKNLFFTDAKQCGNYIIIKPNGVFLKRLSEYRQSDIPDLIKKM